MLHTIRHQTVFNFETTPQSAVQRLHLMPLTSANQRVLNWEIELIGGTVELVTDDFHGNRIHLCRHDAQSNIMQISCWGTVEVEDACGVVGEHDRSLPLGLFRNETPLSKAGARLRRLAREIVSFRRRNDCGDVELMHKLSALVRENIRYVKGRTNVETTAEKAMELGVGVCQDHVHAFTSVARVLGYSARYVSGYLMVNEKHVQEASHAWAEVYLSGLGWVGFDISNVISPDDRYVKLAIGFDYSDVIPVSGVRYGNGDERISTEIIFDQQ